MSAITIGQLRKLLSRIPESQDHLMVMADGNLVKDCEINAKLFIEHKTTGTLIGIQPLGLAIPDECSSSIRDILIFNTIRWDVFLTIEELTHGEMFEWVPS